MEGPGLAYAIFCGVKFVGYTAAAWVLRRVYGTAGPSVLLVGLARTLLGMAAGAVLWGLTIATELPQIAMAGLPLVRIGEWWLILWFFFDRKLEAPGRDWLWACFGVLWSFALDVPALVGLLFIGRAWVC
jgi:hypothetical protein